MSRTQPRTLPGPARGHRGFSIVELLIALIIIAILSAILLPNVTRRAEQARLTSCKKDLETVAAAEDRVATDMGYYVRLFALDDLASGDGIGQGQPNDKLDGVADERNNPRFFTTTNSIFIRIATRTLSVTNTGPSIVAAADATPIFTNILGVNPSTTSPDPNEAPNWYGPYYTIKKDETLATTVDTNDSLRVFDIPDDPWGHDYMLFFRNGYVQEPAGVILDTYTDPATGASYSATIFDRPTIVSFGPDGKPGNNGVGPIGSGDDVVYSFGY